MLLFFFYALEPFDYGVGATPLIYTNSSSNGVVDFVRITLLMMPVSLLAELMSLQGRVFSKLSLCSFRVMKACFFAMGSIRSSISRSAAMACASELIPSTVFMLVVW